MAPWQNTFGTLALGLEKGLEGGGPCPHWVASILLFTCGRRPAGHVMMSVVGVVGVVVVVGGGGGGEQLLYMGSREAHV